MDGADSSRQVRVRFVTKLPPPLRAPPTPIADVPAELSRTGLSEIVNRLLLAGDPDHQAQPFDFIVDGEPVRMPLQQFLLAKGISAERVLELEYVKAVVPKKQEAPCPHDDWVSAVDGSNPRALELAGPLHDLLPPVEFCCVYGSTLLHARPDGTSMVDYILGVADPLQWHSENLERNPMHYSRWMSRLGPSAITRLADCVGVGVHFNPFVEWRDKRIKYGVVGMKDLVMDVLTWDSFYLSGRLQKPVHVLIDNWDIKKVNTVNLKMATSASLLLLPEEFTEYDLYAQICSLSYMGDLRMLFAEDKDKVKKIVDGSFQAFQLMYRPLLQEYISEGLLKTSTYRLQNAFHQDCGVSATNDLFSSLPSIIQRKLQGRSTSDCKETPTRNIVSSKEMAAACIRKALRRRVMVSSARQAVSGLLASGGVVAARYLGKKISKAWKSTTF